MTQKKPIVSIHFLNPFEDFVGKYDGECFEFPSGETVYLQPHLACHFAKHLVNRQLHQKKKETSDPLKHEILKKISPKLEWREGKHLVKVIAPVKGVSQTKSDLEVINANKDALVDPASEIQPPVEEVKVEEAPKAAEVPEKAEEAFDIELASRNQLNEHAEGLGVDKKLISNAPNKGAVKELIKAKLAEG